MLFNTLQDLAGNLIIANYSLAGQILECVKEHSYLGVILDQKMTFTSHINYIVSKAAKVLS